MDLLRHFQNTVRRMDTLRPGDTVVIGVSGGADSLALLHLFATSQAIPDLAVYAVHVHHGIRGEEADADATFVQRTAELWNIPYRIEHADVPGIALKHKVPVEEAARRVRYTALARTAEELGAQVIAVAHNANDQAETVLMHLLRGSGLAGLRGMLPVTALSEAHLLPAEGGRSQHTTPLCIIRPLLDVPRTAIEAYCAEQALEPRVDSTNIDISYTRNRIRHEVMPALKTIAPDVIHMLGRTSKIAAAEWDYINQQVSIILPSLIYSQSDDQIQVDRNAWRQLPLALQRAVIRRILGELGGAEGLSFEHVEHAVRLAQEGEYHSVAQFPHRIYMRIGAGRSLLFTHVDQVDLLPDIPLLFSPANDSMLIDRFGEHTILTSTWRFVVEEYTGMRSGPEWDTLLRANWMKPFAADSIEFPLKLATRHPGLKFYPHGAGGSQTIKEFMNKAKIPVGLRDHIPILTHSKDVIWVCGYRVDERFIVRPETQRVWLARFEKVP